MKKIFGLVALFGLAGIGWAAATATPTLTPTLTFTPGPSVIDHSLQHWRISPRHGITNDDGVNEPGLTPVAGDANGWYSQVQNQSVLNMGTGTSKVRFAWTVPANVTKGKQNGIQAYIYASNSVSNAAAVAVSISVNVYRQPYMAIGGTSTAASFLGITVNAEAWGCTTAGSLTVCAKDILRNNMISRYPLPMPTGVSQCAQGDILNIEIVRTGTTGNLVIRMIEMEWNPINFWNALFESDENVPMASLIRGPNTWFKEPEPYQNF